MNFLQSIKKYAWTVAVLLFAVLAWVLFQKPQKAQVLGSGGPFESTYYEAIGTPSVPVTLGTSSYSTASSSILLAEGLPNIALKVEYTPKSFGSLMYLLLERSVDQGKTWAPYTVLSPQANGTLDYVYGTGTTSGIPFIIPADGAGTTASGTKLTTSFDLSLAADYIRLSAKEVTTSTRGVVSVQALLTSN